MLAAAHEEVVAEIVFHDLRLGVEDGACCFLTEDFRRVANGVGGDAGDKIGVGFRCHEQHGGRFCGRENLDARLPPFLPANAALPKQTGGGEDHEQTYPQAFPTGQQKYEKEKEPERDEPQRNVGNVDLPRGARQAGQGGKSFLRHVQNCAHDDCQPRAGKRQAEEKEGEKQKQRHRRDGEEVGQEGVGRGEVKDGKHQRHRHQLRCQRDGEEWQEGFPKQQAHSVLQFGKERPLLRLLFFGFTI